MKAKARIIHLEDGMRVGERYTLEAPLGSGSMAEVWLARDEERGEPVALKVISELLAPSEQARRRFEREIQIIGRLNHPHIVALLGHGEIEDGRPFLAMELVNGQSLAEYMEREAELLGAYSTLVVATQVLDGLALAHGQGIVHRDLKPANIFLARLPTGGRRVKILDFGVAHVLDLTNPEERLTRTGSVLGSPRYMPLEVARGANEIDARADVFAVGAVMYHCLTGRPPFEGESIGRIMAKIIAHDIAPLAVARPDVPAQLVACVERAMSHEPAGRYPSAAEMRAALLPLLATTPPLS